MNSNRITTYDLTSQNGYNSVTHDLNNYVDSGTTFEAIFTSVNKENSEEKILSTYENTKKEIDYIKIQLYHELKPGKRIVVKEESVFSETTVNNLLNEETYFPNYNIIDNIGNEENTETRLSYKKNIHIDKIMEWITLANSENLELKNKLKEIEIQLKGQKEASYNLQRDNESLKEAYNNKLKINERKAILMKYGLTPYLIFLILSLALFFVSGTLFILWRIWDVTTFNQGVLFYGALIGLGWSATAFAGIYSIKDRMRTK